MPVAFWRKVLMMLRVREMMREACATSPMGAWFDSETRSQMPWIIFGVRRFDVLRAGRKNKALSAEFDSGPDWVIQIEEMDCIF